MPRVSGRTHPSPATPKPRPASSGRAKYTSPDQKKALERCDKVVAGLQKAIVLARDPLLKGIKPKDISVDTLGDFPYVTVKKNGQPLFDRQFEVDALRKLLPASLKNVPIGDVSPY